MKRFLTIAILFLTFSLTAQDRTLTEDLTINSGEDLTYVTLDLNSFDVVMKNNSSLTVENLVGTGNVSSQSNGNGNNQPVLTVTGFVDCGTVTFTGKQSFDSSSNYTDCSLSLNEFAVLSELPMGESFAVIYLTGQASFGGIINSTTYDVLPRNEIFILSVTGYTPRKYFISQ